MPAPSKSWDIQQARELYNIVQWGDGFFDIDENGEVVVYPDGKRQDPPIALSKLIVEIRQAGLTVPILIRFTDILRERINRLCSAFLQSISEHHYQGKHRAVYPIKVNQQRRVVEEILRHGGERVGLEAGSKPELLVVLALAERNTLLVCNGYKDREYIRLALIGQQLGHQIYIILEKLSEVGFVIQEARKMRIQPRLGIRIRLATVGKGKWRDTGGPKSKFGFSAAQVFEALEILRENHLLDSLQAIHFHLGSQVANIRDIYNGMRECARYYAELRKLGAPIQVVDVGGGLAVDYDGTRSRSDSSMNYSMLEYSNNIIYALTDICNEYDLPHPDIITESGRAMTAHHAVLITDIIDVEKMEMPSDIESPHEEAAPILHDLWKGYLDISNKHLLESFHDASYWMSEVYTMYTHGLITLAERAHAEQIYFAVCFKVRDLLDPKTKAHREILDELNEKLADKYFCNFSLFQSLPDSWAINQVFPIIPLSGLNLPPTKRAILQDITCDSDGRIDSYVDKQGIEATLSISNFDRSRPYFIGMFLIGAYQEILGDMHNLFGDTDSIYVEYFSGGKYRLFHPEQGDTVEDVLRYVHFEPTELLQAYRHQFSRSQLTPQQCMEYLQELAEGLKGYTYFEE